jgi:hypothetical protein
MASNLKLLKKRKKTIKRLEEAGFLPKLDAQQLYGSGSDFKYVDPPKGYGIPLRRPKSSSRRPTGSKAALG